jgi:hypothetical protein
LFLPLPFFLGLSLAALFRPLRFEVSPAELVIKRPIGSFVTQLKQISAIKWPASVPAGITARVIGVDGIFGSFGLFWDRNWGWFRAHVTDHRKRIELIQVDGKRLIISPDEPMDFIDVLKDQTDRSSLEVVIPFQGDS